MITINIADILKDTTFPDGGVKVYDIAQKAIKNGDSISIDMLGIDSVPTMFMNTSFGALIDEFGISKIKISLRFKNISKTQFDRIKKYFIDYESLLNKEKGDQ